MEKNIKIEHTKDFEKDKELLKKIEKDEYVEKYKKNYQKYKLEIKKKRDSTLIPYNCECGKIIKDNKRKDIHLATKLHSNYMKLLKELNKK